MTQHLGELVISVDVGGGSIKVGAVDADDFVIRRRASRAVKSTHGAQPSMWLQDLHANLVTCVSELEIDPAQVVGVSVASMRHTTILVASENQVIAVILNTDRRATDHASGSRAHAAMNGNRLDAAIFAPARLRWARSAGLIGEGRAVRVLSLSDWIVEQLTGRAWTAPSQASDTGLYDVYGHRWIAHPDDVHLPEVHDEGDPVAVLQPGQADALGLFPGTPVFNAGSDTHCAFVSAQLDEGEVLVVGGTTSPCLTLLPKRSGGQVEAAVEGLQPGWISALPGNGTRYIVEANPGITGAAINWALSLTYGQCADAFDAWVTDMRELRSGAAEGVRLEYAPRPASAVPGRSPDAEEQGRAVLQMDRFASLITDIPASRAAIVNAVITSCLERTAKAVQQLETAVPVRRVVLCGGQSRSTVLSDALGQMLGRPVDRVPETDATLRGAAMLAASNARREAVKTQRRDVGKPEEQPVP